MADEARTEVANLLAERVGSRRLTSAEVEAILGLAGAAAHRAGDRTAAPLASFLAGLGVRDRDDWADAVDELRRVLEDGAL